MMLFILSSGTNAITAIPSEMGMLGNLQKLWLCKCNGAGGMCCYCLMVEWEGKIILNDDFSGCNLQIKIQSVPFPVRWVC